MCFNARSILDDSFWEFVPLDQPFPDLPGSWDKEASLSTLKTLCAMSGAFLAASDLMRDSVWRLRLWRTIAVAGCSIILYGLIVKGFGQESLISMYRGQYVQPTFFGPYRYHATAGDYLNLIWPVLLSLLIISWRKRQAHVEQAVWLFWLLMGLAACFVNTSKGAAFITLLMLVAAGFSFRGFLYNQFIRTGRVSRMLVFVVILGLVAILIYGGITSELQGRWDRLFLPGGAEEAVDRLLVDGVCLRMIPEAGWFGFGPGTFSSVFPFHTLYLGNRIEGFWRYAHEDYLQTVVEYGYVGTAIWSLLFFGSIYETVIRGLQTSLSTQDRVFYRASTLALGGLAIHSLFDFPLQVASIQLYAAIFFAYAWRPGEYLKKRRHSKELISPGDLDPFP